MRLAKHIRHFSGKEDGAAAVEFALVAVPFFLMFMGILEFGLISMTRAAIEGATAQVARSSAVCSNSQICGSRASQVQQLITQKTSGLINAQAVLVTAKVLTAGAPRTQMADICLIDSAVPNPPACVDTFNNPGPFENNDGVTGYQQSAGVTAASIGNSGDLVELRVTYPWRVLFPVFSSYFGENGVLTISASTVVKNE